MLSDLCARAKNTNQETFPVVWYCVISTQGTPVGHASPALDNGPTAREECHSVRATSDGIKTAIMNSTANMIISSSKPASNQNFDSEVAYPSLPQSEEVPLDGQIVPRI
jgi:hypothetical protein